MSAYPVTQSHRMSNRLYLQPLKHFSYCIKYEQTSAIHFETGVNVNPVVC